MGGLHSSEEVTKIETTTVMPSVLCLSVCYVIWKAKENERSHCSSRFQSKAPGKISGKTINFFFFSKTLKKKKLDIGLAQIISAALTSSDPY